jgi:hypothetical protein
MNPVEEFRNHADECRAMARSIKDLKSRVEWNSLAERWLRCAEVAERAMAEATAAADRYNRTRKTKQWSEHDAR